MAMGPLAGQTGGGGDIPAVDGLKKQAGELGPGGGKGNGGGVR